MQCVISQCLATWKKYLKNKKIKNKKTEGGNAVHQFNVDISESRNTKKT